jgi:hypothetical protein
MPASCHQAVGVNDYSGSEYTDAPAYLSVVLSIIIGLGMAQLFTATGY